VATRTASVTELWSNTATWGGAAVPVDTDNVVINTGVTVTFNVNQSAFASGIAGIAINGTGRLQFSTDGTVTYLKASGNISGAGSLYIGNSDADPIPAPAGSTPEVATLAFNGNFGITITGTVETHGELRNPAAAITSKTDNTHIIVAAGGPTFRAGDVICISDSTVIGKHSPATESFTVSAYNAGTREITLGSSLTRSVNQNSVTDYVLLVSRNILLLGMTNASNFLSGTGVTLVIKGARFSWSVAGGSVVTANTGGSGPGTTSGAEFAYCTADGLPNTFTGYATSTTRYIAITACVSINSTSGMVSYYAPTVTNCYALNCTVGILGNATLADGAAVGCVALNCTNGGLMGATNFSKFYIVNCIAYNCTHGMLGGSNSVMGRGKVVNCTFRHNTNDINGISNILLFNTLLDDASEVVVANLFSLPNTSVMSFDHDQVAGAFKAWTFGGNVTSVSSPVFDTSRVRSFQHGPTSALFPVFMEREILVPAGASLYVRCYVRKTVTMTYLPRLWVFSLDKEPLITGSPDSEQIMTNSIDTWEILTATVTNSSDSPKLYMVRTLAKNASGLVYFDPIIRTSSFIADAGMLGGMAS